jgi:hypothetical protein
MYCIYTKSVLISWTVKVLSSNLGLKGWMTKSGVQTYGIALYQWSIFKETQHKGSISPEVELRFCPGLLLFKYCTGGHDLSSFLCLYYTYLW